MPGTVVHYLSAIEAAETEGSPTKVEGLTGFSGEKLLGALQRLTAVTCDDENVYLEIGVYQGLSLISVAAACPQVTVMGIDNFAYFDVDGRNKALVLERARRAQADNVELIDLDYEDALEGLPERLGTRRIGLLFVDGPHDYRSQLMCLLLARDLLADGAVVVIDDCNYAHVRQANRDFLATHPSFGLLYENYTSKHPANMGDDEEADARSGWWNGVNIIAHDPARTLPRIEQPTVRSRLLFENDHDVHALRQAAVAPDATRAANLMRPLRPLKLARQLLVVFNKARNNKEASANDFDSLNVNTAGLGRRINAVADPQTD